MPMAPASEAYKSMCLNRKAAQPKELLLCILFEHEALRWARGNPCFHSQITWKQQALQIKKFLSGRSHNYKFVTLHSRQQPSQKTMGTTEPTALWCWKLHSKLEEMGHHRLLPLSMWTKYTPITCKCHVTELLAPISEIDHPRLVTYIPLQLQTLTAAADIRHLPIFCITKGWR